MPHRVGVKPTKARREPALANNSTHRPLRESPAPLIPEYRIFRRRIIPDRIEGINRGRTYRHLSLLPSLSVSDEHEPLFQIDIPPLETLRFSHS